LSTLVRERELNKALSAIPGIMGIPQWGRTFCGHRISVIRSAEIHRLEVFAPVRLETLKQLNPSVSVPLGERQQIYVIGAN
jgi:hypothetical protein